MVLWLGLGNENSFLYFSCDSSSIRVEKKRYDVYPDNGYIGMTHLYLIEMTYNFEMNIICRWI